MVTRTYLSSNVDKPCESAHNIFGIGIDRELPVPDRNRAAGRLAIVDFPIGKFRYILEREMA